MPADGQKESHEYKLLRGKRKTAYGLFTAARTRNGGFYGGNVKNQIKNP
jgi:hypothetical protein